MKILAFSNKKGGVGKTTTALCVAAYLGTLNKKVLAIDLDGQSNFTTASNGEEMVQGTLEFLKGAPLEEVIQKAARYDFIGSDRRLSEHERDFDDFTREKHLGNALKNIKENYDYVVLDTPPSMGIITLNALTAADEVVICCQADGFSVEGLKSMRKNIDDIKSGYNPNLKVGGILLTRYNARTNLSKQLIPIFDKAAEAMGSRVFDNYIRENTALKEAQIMRKDIYTYDPASNGANDYAAFVQEWLGGEL